MQNETIYEGLKQEFRGLKDPGNILILVYILLIVVLLLFAGLQSAKADFHVKKEGTFSIEHRGDSFHPRSTRLCLSITCSMSKRAPLCINPK